MEAFREHLDPERFVPLVKAGSLSEQTFTKACLSCEAFLASPEPFPKSTTIVNNPQQAYPHSRSISGVA